MRFEPRRIGSIFLTGLIVLLTTIYVKTPLEFNIFPSLLLATTLKRAGEPDDVARTVRFLVCDAPYVSGQIIAVDGGRSIHL